MSIVLLVSGAVLRLASQGAVFEVVAVKTA